MFKYIGLCLLIIGLTFLSCSDPNTIGLEVQPNSDYITIGSTDYDNFTSSNESEDSIRTDEPQNMILGQIIDDEFGINQGGFYTQILLKENNIDLGENPIVDSVILSYSYSGYYGDLTQFSGLEVRRIFSDIHKDSIYYSNSFQISADSINNVESYSISQDTENPFIRIKLNNDFGQQILNLGNDAVIDNESFLQLYNGICISSSLGGNAIMYLNPSGSFSFLKIYYHNSNNSLDTLALEFELGSDAARINLFNDKNNVNVTEDNTRLYVQSMAGYKVKISINKKDSIKSLLNGKVINNATITFNIENGSTNNFLPHEKLVLVRVDSEGTNTFLSDFTIEGDAYFGGYLESDKYEFTITRYLYNFLNNPLYTNELYLLPAGSAINANRTLLSNDFKLRIYYSEL